MKTSNPLKQIEDYEKFYENLTELSQGKEYANLKVKGYMPLSVEYQNYGKGHERFTLTHYGKQNGDLMADPDVVFKIVRPEKGKPLAEPISFRNDYMGINREVYLYDDQGREEKVNIKEKQSLKSFCSMWFRNLKSQGFFQVAKEVSLEKTQEPDLGF